VPLLQLAVSIQDITAQHNGNEMLQPKSELQQAGMSYTMAR
jgi:hypothetical protein